MVKKSYKELRSKMSLMAQKKSEAKAKAMIRDMALNDLRQARSLSQEHLAQILRTKQANISKIERRVDMYISTLRDYIEAMGGELEITAHFPDLNVRINQFQQLDPKITEQQLK
jgi:transcriptional regulator with XRE-family HTH domain